MLVEKPLYDEFVSKFAELAGELKVGDPLDPETQMGSLISAGAPRPRARLRRAGTRARAPRSSPAASVREGPGAFYPPTVLAGVDNAMTVAQEEIFGPVVTVIPFEDEADAIRIANDVRYGLMATVWTGDPARGHRLAARIKSGTVGINMPYTAFPGHPVRRLQAVRLRPRARDRDARALPGDEERDRLHRPEADQPRSALVARPSRYRWAVLAAGTTAQASFSAITLGVPVLAPALRDQYDLTLTSSASSWPPSGSALTIALRRGGSRPTGSASGTLSAGLAPAPASSSGRPTRRIRLARGAAGARRSRRRQRPARRAAGR